MTKKNFLDIIDKIDDNFIAETEEDMRDESGVSKFADRRKYPTAFIGAAACAVAAMIITVTAVSYYNGVNVVTPNSAISASHPVIPENGYIEAESLADNAQAELNNLRLYHSIDKLDISKATLTVPSEIGDLYNLTITHNVEPLRADMWTLFLESVKQAFPESDRIDEMDNYFYGTYSYMPISYGLERIMNGEISPDAFMYDTESNGYKTRNEYMLMDKYGGITIKKNLPNVQRTSTLAGWNPLESFSVKIRYILSGAALPGNGSEEVYKAAAFCEDYLANDALFSKNSRITLKACEIMPLEDQYDLEKSYLVKLARSYNGILFDTLGEREMHSDSGTKYFGIDSNKIMVSESGELQYVSVTGLNDTISPAGRKFDGVISIEEACRSASSVLGMSSMYTLDNIALVYCDHIQNPYISNPDTTSAARLNWRMIVTSSENVRFYIYVDTLDGSVTYTARTAEKDLAAIYR